MWFSLEKCVCKPLLTATRKIASVTAKERTIIINDKKINYIIEGHGPHTLFFLTGLMGSFWTHFGPQIEGFDKNKFTKVFWDTPGFAKSKPPIKKFHVDIYEEDAETAYKFMKELGFDRYSLVGYCDGGRISIISAAKYPESIEKLVLMSTFSFVTKEDLATIGGLRDINNWPEVFKESAVTTYPKDEFDIIVGSLYETYVKYFERGSVCEEYLEQITCTTLILQGDKDDFVPPHHAQHLLSKIKGSRLHSFPNGKHFDHLKNPEEYEKLITDFITE